MLLHVDGLGRSQPQVSFALRSTNSNRVRTRRSTAAPANSPRPFQRRCQFGSPFVGLGAPGPATNLTTRGPTFELQTFTSDGGLEFRLAKQRSGPAGNKHGRDQIPRVVLDMQPLPSLNPATPDNDFLVPSRPQGARSGHGGAQPTSRGDRATTRDGTVAQSYRNEPHVIPHWGYPR